MGGISNPPAAGGPAQATQAAIEAETNEDTYAPPNLMKHSPGVAKVWCKANSDGNIEGSYNMTSVTDIAIGKITFTIATDFSSTDYVANVNLRSLFILTPHEVGRGAGSMNWECNNDSGVLTDPVAWMMTAVGPQ